MKGLSIAVTAVILSASTALAQQGTGQGGGMMGAGQGGGAAGHGWGWGMGGFGYGGILTIVIVVFALLAVVSMMKRK